MTSRGGGGGGGGRDRFRKDYPSRFEEKSHSGRISNSNPPSRHLWVGNLAHSIFEQDLTHHFLQFGELETVAFQSGRSYAFINFRRDEDAIAAMRALQGFPVAGNPLRIEFAKADKASVQSRSDDLSQRREEQHYALKGSPFTEDFRAHDPSPDPYYPENSKLNEKNTEPSEVLWIGFPASLKVDEMILRKSFSPFGEIEKITAFPGRSYAFIRFRTLISACRAKENLQGKLFGNPRVHICFARNEGGSSNNSGRSSVNPPLSPDFEPDDHLGFTNNFHPDENFGSATGDLSIRSQFLSNLNSRDSDSYNLKRKMYGYHDSPTKETQAHFLHELPQKYSQKGPYDEEPWDLPEDVYLFNGAKKLKTATFPPDKELPEYPLSDLYSDSAVSNKRFETSSLGYKTMPDLPMRSNLPPYGGRSEKWIESYDTNITGSSSMLINAMERKRFIPDSKKRPSISEWKWEGTIAKGGTPVCRAHCFPVGKVMDIMLPEFLDCTARTGLDMLSKHYYEAASAWVVFFVPETDSDITYYNEFMHYLGEKQRAAVAKLDDKTTLFLVPPSDFSEKVLKVPGKLSISGVILRLESNPGSNYGPGPWPFHHQNQGRTFNSDNNASLYTTPSKPSPPISDFSSSALFSGPGQKIGNLSGSYNEPRPKYPIPPRVSTGPTWLSSHHLPNSDTGNSSINSPMIHEHHQLGKSATYPESQPSVSLTMQPEQLAQLASTLLGKQRQSDLRPKNPMNDSENNSFGATQNHGFQSSNNQGISNNQLTSQFGRDQQLHLTAQKEIPTVGHGSHQVQNAGVSGETEGDPQKRLQATLQLAAALLQQIQQGKGN